MSTEKPHIEHDCEECILIGRIQDPYGPMIYDGYVAEHGSSTSIIIRFGGGGEYTSIPISVIASFGNHPAIDIFKNVLKKYEELKNGAP